MSDKIQEEDWKKLALMFANVLLDINEVNRLAGMYWGASDRIIPVIKNPNEKYAGLYASSRLDKAKKEARRILGNGPRENIHNREG